jgi:hypothetical protein
MTASASPYEVKSPADILAEDVICQSFIQSSSTLAYACLLIRRGRHDLAAHVLHSLEAKPASRFKDMVFYLQCQIGIETGDFGAVKRRLVARAHQHLGDMVALSLLESCIHLEYEDWRRRNPEAVIPEEQFASTLPEPLPEEPAEAAPFRGAVPSYNTLAVPTVPSSRADPAGGIPADAMEESPLDLAALADTPLPGSLATIAPIAATPVPAAFPASQPRPSVAKAPPVPAGDPGAPYTRQPGGADLGLFQPLAADANTQALSLWNSVQRRQRSDSRKEGLDPLMASLPELVPLGLAEAVRSLDGGEINKVCFSFQAITVTTLHAGPEHLGLVTGPISQSLLTMVRAENIFLKQGPGATSRNWPADSREPRAQGAPR